MPDIPDIGLAAGARSLIRNGFMQNDLDANFNKIINLDTSNLNLTGPNNFPAQAHKWIRSYDSSTKNFAASQPDILSDILNFPTISGQSGKFLTNNGTVLSWSTTPSGGASSGWINVKDAPYNAVGNGVVDDSAAILAALTAANGRTVYFPKGIYYCASNIDASLINAVTIMGENPVTSVLLARRDIGGALLTVGNNAFIQRMGFHGNITAGMDGNPVKENRIGLGIVNATNVVIRDCVVVYCSLVGILAVACYSQLFIQNNQIAGCGLHGIEIAQCPRTTVVNNAIFDCPNGCGIFAVNSQQSIIKHNTVYRCGHISFAALFTTAVTGITLADCDNSVVDGNIIHQCGVGMLLANSGIRTPQLISYGYSASGNIVIRNYFAGALLSLCNGFRFSGNNVIDNGQGGTDDATATLEPGFIINNGGSGYTPGQVLTVSGGTGTQAKMVVLTVGAGGAITSVYPLSMGTYTVFPTNPVGVTVGGANFIMTTSRITAAGTGYTRGLVLRSNTSGHNGHPAKIIITDVGASGQVLNFAVLDGGGYTTPPANLHFLSDAQTDAGAGIDIGDAGSGLQITPLWGNRFSKMNNGQKSFGIGTLGPIASGGIGGNIVDSNLGSGIQIMEILASAWAGRAQLLIISGNHILLNTTSIKGWTIGTTDLDCDITLNNMIETNFIYPADCTILGSDNTSPFA